MDELLQSLPQQGVALLRILIAGLCGLLLGMERSKREKEAGLRTHFVVATASALLMSVSIRFANDTARIAAQIVTGIGFLGAGMIFFRRESLHGLTTAAGIWATAGIGMATGCGMYIVALGTTLIIFLAMTVFHSRHFNKNTKQLLLVRFVYTKDIQDLLQRVFEVEIFNRFKATEIDGKIIAEAVLHTKKDCSAEVLAKLIQGNTEIIAMERLEDL